MDLIEAQAHDGTRLAACPYGGHLTSWHSADGVERLFLSPLAVSGPGQSIRGGVPVCFPQFSGFGTLPKHGFVRNRRWDCVAAGTDAEGRASLRFAIADDDDTRRLWPFAFHCELEATAAGRQLELALQVRNTGDTALSFTVALHGYFAVSDLAQAELRGLEASEWIDHAGPAAGIGVPQPAEFTPLRFGAEVDRVYPALPGVIRLATGAGDLLLTQSGFSDAVVWNPGPDKAAALTDLPPGGERHYVCVEAAVIHDPVVLAPGARWRGVQTVRVDGCA